jgi:hypothetical protein
MGHERLFCAGMALFFFAEGWRSLFYQPLK